MPHCMYREKLAVCAPRAAFCNWSIPSSRLGLHLHLEDGVTASGPAAAKLLRSKDPAPKNNTTPPSGWFCMYFSHGRVKSVLWYHFHLHFGSSQIFNRSTEECRVTRSWHWDTLAARHIHTLGLQAWNNRSLKIIKNMRQTLNRSWPPRVYPLRLCFSVR